MEIENTDQTELKSQNIVENPPSRKNVFTQKGNFILIVGLVFILFVGVVLGGYYFLNTKKNTADLIQNDKAKPQAIPTQSSIVQSIPNSVDKIAYITKGEVWIVNEDGSDSKKLLSHTPVTFNNPNLTPAQNKVISNKFNNDFFFDLSWSRDGKKLAVTGYSKLEEEKAKNEKFGSNYAKDEIDYYTQVWYPPHGDIYLVDVETGQSEIIEATKADMFAGDVQWSYDNEKILFSRSGQIVMANVDSKNRDEKVLINSQNSDLAWFPERGEVWFKYSYAYHIDNPEPSLIRFNYAQNQRDEKPVKVTKGYRLHTFSFLKDGKIMYFNIALGPDNGTEYNTYEVRVSNRDGSNSKVLYTGKDCGGEKYRERCYYAHYSPDGKYAIGDVIYLPETPEKTVSEEGGTTWNKDGDKTAYNESGIVVKDMTTMSQKIILRNSDIREIKWAY